ncbi:MAG: protein-methionine-sulfoxide reductase catalytic subunit MsrP [Planctomycetota bacterium]|nr:protein-methionine-sulfoxide reductase catalytic subunit MsrP [Planctomycetaceae bacterium]MDQ3332669.1 protein-methionine-sulfoxide reductase catalytic subunit MsrP [Planctomycetota bacterium]
MTRHIVRRPWDLRESLHTPPEIFFAGKRHRRDFLKAMGIGGIAASGLLVGCGKPDPREVELAGKAPAPPDAFADRYPAERNAAFEYGRPETDKNDAATYTNFYEFSTGKDSWRYVSDFSVAPWSFEVTGLCAKPRSFDLDDVYSLFTLEERAYRHRCVETWAMCVPWTGFPLAELLKLVGPKPNAKHLAFTTYNEPAVMPGIARTGGSFPWPYTESLSIEEAMNDLALLVTGVYGEPLPKQHGAPIRLVVPWKYGFKSAKSIAKIELTDKQPATFWNVVQPNEYGTVANVNPHVPHPRWSQANEWMLPSRSDTYPTQIFNGYGEFVGGLYPDEPRG